MIGKAYEESEGILNCPEYWTVDMCEMYLKKYACILHPDHMLMVRIKSKLAGLYGRCPGYDMMEMTYNRAILDRKLQICRQALQVLERLQPGLSRARAVLLYELHLPLFMAAKMDLDGGVFSVSQAKSQFEEALNYLRTAIELLKYEQEGTLESTIHQGAIMQAQQLEVFVSRLA